MKKFSLLFFLLFATLFVSEKAFTEDTISQERYNKVCKWGLFNPPECKKRISNPSSDRIIKKDAPGQPTQETNAKDLPNQSDIKITDKDCRWGMFNPPKCRGDDKRVSNKSTTKKRNKSSTSILNSGNQNIALYTGTFDVIDKVGDDQTALFGFEHKNQNLFRDTWLGRFSPTTGAFVTGKSSVYLYTGIEADYNLGPINLSPSFAPGYYQKGDGKDLGSVLEFKSEVKIGFDIFENTNLGYSYSHISNNDWGKTNPGTDNQQITFSKKF
jgi:lipid A 3-O-deacylase|tara:strand:- start:243 stop:1052 length:810 start_codon:yes stop_codon:yes gene_type:complete